MKKNDNEYKLAGVDVEAGYKSVELIKPYLKETNISGVMGNIGGFCGLFKPDIKNYKEPILVSSTDGVGTKLKIASILNKHSTIGIDCVAMCVNDIICSGATPLFFLDYIACGKNYPEKIAEIVSGVASGCKKAGVALIGGETAEHPKLMKEKDYDIAGFSVGIVEKENILPKQNLNFDDILIALPSSGLHSNGFSLVREVFDVTNTDLTKIDDFLSESLGDVLLKPTTIYVNPIKFLLKNVEVKAICHITGGGFFENIPRMLPEDMSAVIYKKNLIIHKIFKLIMKKANISENNMFNIFNMGVGMILVVNKNNEKKVLETLNSVNVKAYVIGKLTKADVKVKII